MSLFFRHIPSVEAGFSVKEPSNAIAENVVLLSQDIWDALCFSGESYKTITIRPKRQYLTRPRPHHLDSLTCWAIHDPTASEVAIPPSWLVKYPAIFQPFQMGPECYSKPVIISGAGQTALEEVVLTAKSEEAYKLAFAHGAAFESWLFESRLIIRDGEDIFLPRTSFPLFADSVDGWKTPSLPSFGYNVSLALPYKQGTVQRGSTRFIVTLAEDLSSASPPVGSPFPVHDRDESLEINESFLISATLRPPEPLARADESCSLFLARALRSPIDVDLDEVTVYVCTSKLHLLGVLNGDWVLASCIDSSRSRLVRVCALDEILIDSRFVLLSPTLLHNLCLRGRAEILLSLSPFGSRDPGIPTAKSITLARIASPFSMNRRYEPLLVDALHAYFGSSKRLVQDGDVIFLFINIDHSLDSHNILHRKNRTCVTRTSSRVPVYFIARQVEYEASALRTHGRTSTPRVGCFVDASVTRIVQVGLEHGLVLADHPHFTSPTTFGISRPMLQLLNAMSLEAASSLGVQSTILVSGPRGSGKFSTIARIAQQLQMHLAEINCYDVLSDSLTKTEASLRERLKNFVACSPCMVVLRHMHAFSHLSQDNMNGKEESSVLQALQPYIEEMTRTHGWQCIMVGTTELESFEGMSFVNELKIKALSEEERCALLLEQLCTQGKSFASDVSVATLAKQTASLVACDLEDLVRQTCIHAMKSICIHQIAPQPVMYLKQFTIMLARAHMRFAQSIGAPSIPTVLWDDVGGLAQVKDEIMDTVQLPLDHPELFQDGLKKRSGVLLYGPPGTGKTLVAKAVATSCSLNFLSVKGPELLNMYIGESEANVRQVFQRARDAKPCVIFFDELDSIAPKRGNQGDSGGVMDRIVSQLLAELDGMSVGSMDVFVIGATNRPDLLDPALLRPGRFDRMLYLGVPGTHEAQLDILKALTRKFSLHYDLNLSSIAAHCPFTYTGADFYALCADALLHALSNKVEALEKERAYLNMLLQHQQHPISPQFFVAEMVSEADLQLTIGTEDFQHALDELIPSISSSELLHYISIQKNWGS